MAAIDLYSGIGGWTLGFRMAGIDIISSYEWWSDANITHNRNFGTNHNEIDIRSLRLEMLPNPIDVDFVIGSPPCTQFSYANRGGKGDIADGLIDIYKFLEIVEYLNPKYWAMENVPRVAKILKKEIQQDGILHRFRNLFGENCIRIYDASEFGVPQKRKRMIAGNYPFEILDSYKVAIPELTMGDVINALNQDRVVDPIYGIELDRVELTDNTPEPPLSIEETRINENAKSYHPVYNMMNFPDRLDRPSRTVTALCTRVSRESIVIQDNENNFRRLTVRERGCMQSFPINFQYHSNTYGGKLKMIGNAIPPILTFYIAQSMLERSVEELLFPNQVANPLYNPGEMPVIHQPDNRGANYPWSRSFWLAIPGLRFGSGIRFELRNYHDRRDQSTSWKINFFYGNSRNIKQKNLNERLSNTLIDIINEIGIASINELLEEFIEYCQSIDLDGLQINWTNRNRERMSPIELIDEIGIFSTRFIEITNQENLNESTKEIIHKELRNGNGRLDNQKLIDLSNEVFVGLVLGSCFNTILSGQRIQIEMTLQ